MTNRASLSWTATADAAAGDYVARVDLDAASPNGADYEVSLLSNVFGTPGTVPAEFVVVDNGGNKGTILVEYGNLIWTIPGYTVKTLRLPNNLRLFKATITGTTARLIFLSSARNVLDYENTLAITTAANEVAVFPFRTIDVTSSQETSDSGKVIRFNPTVSDINYNLLDILTGPVPNGFYSQIRNDGTKFVNIVPAGLNTINGLYDIAGPLPVGPGDKIELFSDGNTWYAKGTISYDTINGFGPTSPANGLTFTLIPKFKRQPDRSYFYIINGLADLNYGIGDRISFDRSLPYNSNDIGMVTDLWRPGSPDTTVLRFHTGAGGTLKVPNRTTGLLSTINNANWNLYARLEKDL